MSRNKLKMLCLLVLVSLFLSPSLAARERMWFPNLCLGRESC